MKSGRKEMDPPLCGSTAMSHNEFQSSKLIEPQEASPMKHEMNGSSRAQARTTVGREFPISALSMAERGPSPTIAHVSCALSKIPYGGFSPVRLQAEVSL